MRRLPIAALVILLPLATVAQERETPAPDDAPGTSAPEAEMPQAATPGGAMPEAAMPSREPGPADDRGPAGRAGVALPDRERGPGPMHNRMMDRDRGGHGPMGPHHGRHADRGRDGASISVEIDDRELSIRCGSTPIAECVEGASPLFDLLR